MSLRRSPHGERGLKLKTGERVELQPTSLPTRGAWIEMNMCYLILTATNRRSPHGERGLKLSYNHKEQTTTRSLPTRGAWIEITVGGAPLSAIKVAPHTGSVD